MKFSLILLILFSVISCKVAKDQQALSSQNSIKSEDSFSYSPSNVELIAGITSVVIEPNIDSPMDYTYSISPTLPTGLSFSTTSGKISGTASVVTTQTIYSIKATNSKEVLNAVFTLSVIEQLPTGIYYSSSPISFTKGSLGTSGTPTVTGGTPTGFSVNPNLPAGLTLNTTTGVISGTPVNPSSGLYYITATNSSGSFTESIYITVADLAPTAISYALSPLTVAKDDLMSVMSPTITGNPTYKYFSITPKLPTGLTLDTTSGVIYGTPTTATGNLTYTVTVSNDVGSASNTIQINVTGAPTSLNYPDDLELEQNVFMTPVLASPTGGKPTTYTVTAGALPPGVNLNGSTGTLYGKPTTLGSYSATITGTNGYGSVAKSVDFEIIEDQPSAMNYLSSYTFYVDQVTSVLPNPTGGSPSSYTITPALPAGLALNAATGEISGTPTVYTNQMSYIIQGANSTGIVTEVVNIEVKEQAPTSLGYSPLMTFYKDVTTATVSPTPTGGTPTQYLITPSLPVGLSFNVLTGEITGTPAVTSTYKTYAIKGWNSGGYKTESVQIKVEKTAPFNFNYNGGTNIVSFNLFNSPTFGNNVSFSPNVEGTQIISFSISPTILPAGLTFNTTTGVIEGVPEEVFASTAYTVTAYNIVGAQVITINLEVLNVPPTNLTYAGTPFNYVVGETITDVTPTSDFDTQTGGFIESYSVLPALPAGLDIDNTTGVLSGTPTLLVEPLDFIQPTVTYTVTGSNTAGSDTFDIDITVIDEAPNFYFEDPNDNDDEFNIWGGVDPDPIEPIHLGGDIATNDDGVPTDHCFISDDINADTGLDFDGQTCEITGTPSCGVDDTFTYDITGENSGGDWTTSITINLFDGPDFTYDTFLNSDLQGFGLSSLEMYLFDGISTNHVLTADSDSGCMSPFTEFINSPDFPIGLNLDVMTGDVTANEAGMFLRSIFDITGYVDFTALETEENEVSVELQVNHMPDISARTPTVKLGNVIGDFNLDGIPDILVYDFGTSGEQDLHLLVASPNGMGSFLKENTIIDAQPGLLDGEHLQPQFIAFDNTQDPSFTWDTGIAYLTYSVGMYTLNTQSFNWLANNSNTGVVSDLVGTYPILKVTDETDYSSGYPPSSPGSTAWMAYKLLASNQLEIVAVPITTDASMGASTLTTVLNKTLGGIGGTATTQIDDFVLLETNNDGFYDMAVAWSDATYSEICILESTAAYTFSNTCSTIITLPSGGQVKQMIAGDIVRDNSNLIDFLVLDDGGNFFVYRNDGQSFITSFVPSFSDYAVLAGVPDKNDGYDITFGHYDSTDNYYDVAILDEMTNEVFVYYNQGQLFPTPTFDISSKQTIAPFDYFPVGTHLTNTINSIEIWDDLGLGTIGTGMLHCEYDDVSAINTVSCGIPTLYQDL